MLRRRRRRAPASAAATASILTRSKPVCATTPTSGCRGCWVPPTDDLRFSTDCVRFYNTGVAVGQDAIIARFRYPDGTPSGGIHRIYLKPDGSWHDGKKMLGPVDGAVVMLGQPCRGLLGIAEGIESALAASALFGGVPGWAA